MLLGIVLLYVGAALLVNGIWLVGQARRAATAAPAAMPELGAEFIEQTRSRESGGGVAVAERRIAPPRIQQAMRHVSFLEDREIAVINIFTAGVGIVVATLLVVLGAINNERANIADAAFILLFAFTYMWVAANQFLKAGNRAFGWFCFFIAVTAVPTAIHTLIDADGASAAIWLGIDWILWAVLWFLFFLLLAVELPIARLVGWATIAVAVGTAWAFGYAILLGFVTFT